MFVFIILVGLLLFALSKGKPTTNSNPKTNWEEVAQSLNEKLKSSQKEVESLKKENSNLKSDIASKEAIIRKLVQK